MEIKIISTDFDGTLVSNNGWPAFVPELVERIELLRQQGAVWAINTGRSLWHIVEGLQVNRFPHSPDFVLTNEREVFRRSADHGNHDGWEDFGEWNTRCANEHELAFQTAGEFFTIIESYAMDKGRLRVMHNDISIEGLVAETEDDMDEVVQYIDEIRTRFPQVSYQRNSVYLRFCHIDYHKGSALTELARLLGVEHSQIFAIGDNHNDIPMLDGGAAAMNACPGNSVPEVKQLVQQVGGYIATDHASAGVVEALDHFTG